LLPVYNGGRFLDPAIKSIREQTFADFELIAVDDGSKDDSLAVLQRHAAEDPRIKVISRPNRGIVATLNEGLSVCRGEYIARMDADDIAAPQRFALQIEYMDAHPDCLVVGSGIIAIDENGNEMCRLKYPANPTPMLLQRSCLAHPAVMIRTEPLRRAGGYRLAFRHAEDYDLWLRLAEIGPLANLPDYLLYYRQHNGKVTVQNALAQAVASAAAAASARRRRACGVDPADGHDALTPELLAQLDLSMKQIKKVQLIGMMDTCFCFVGCSSDLNEIRDYIVGFKLEMFRQNGVRVWQHLLLMAVIEMLKTRSLNIPRRVMKLFPLLPFSAGQRMNAVCTIPYYSLRFSPVALRKLRNLLARKFSK